MKPPSPVRPYKQRAKHPPKEPARAGKSGEGARSAMEQVILQEKARATDPGRITRSH